MEKKLKRVLSKLISKTIDYPKIWKFYKSIAEIHADLYLVHLNVLREKRNEQFFERYKEILGDQVKEGPFKGLKYPFFYSIYSAFFPKLLGYYEFELQAPIETLKDNSYSKILDIGCAEGYYAVGLALIFQQSDILAYDLDPIARQKTLEMATANGIKTGSRFQIREACTQESLLALDPKASHLIFSDCEGYELELFSDQVIEHLILSDFIIEVHDFIIPGTSDFLQEKFSRTHKVQVIKSIDDIHRYRLIQDTELAALPISDQIRLLAEKRQTQMEWLICTKKTTSRSDLTIN